MTGLIPAIAGRKSARHFARQPVSPETLTSLLEAFRWAPSSLNRQPWRVILAAGRDAQQVWDDSLTPPNRAWAPAAPVKLVVLGNPTEQLDEHGQARWLLDCGLAIGQLLIQACGLGMSVRAMVGFDEQRVLGGFAIPAPFRVAALIAAGHPGRVEELAPEVQEKERRPRLRKPLAEIAFRDRFGNPIG